MPIQSALQLLAAGVKNWNAWLVAQVLLLDADSQPLKDPATLFDLASFQEHGNLFWSDFWSEGFAEASQAPELPPA